MVETLAQPVLKRIVLAENRVLMNGTGTSDEVFWTNHPSAPDSSSCEDFTSGVHTQHAIMKILMFLYDFGSGVSEHIVIGHALIDIVLNNDDVRVLPHYVCNLVQLFVGENLAHWVVGSSDDEYLSFFIDGCLELSPVEVPFVLISGLNRRFLESLDYFCLGMLCKLEDTSFLGLNWMPIVFPPAIWTCGL